MTLLRQGTPRKDRVAEYLNTSERTLQRRLQDANTSYQALLDDLRQEKAQEWLLHSQLPIPEIAERLGFTEVRSFHRRFKDWTQQTPGEFRGNKGR